MGKKLADYTAQQFIKEIYGIDETNTSKPKPEKTNLESPYNPELIKKRYETGPDASLNELNQLMGNYDSGKDYKKVQDIVKYYILFVILFGIVSIAVTGRFEQLPVALISLIVSIVVSEACS